MTRSAEAFQAALDELGIDESELDAERFGRRAALLAASELLWNREVGPLVTTSRLQDLLRCSRQAINERVRNGRILALPTDKGEHLYPLWQFGLGSQPLPGIAEIVATFAGAVATPWTIASWLVGAEQELDGKAPIEVLRSGDAGTALAAARHYAERLRR
jgi:hypothetical protein